MNAHPPSLQIADQTPPPAPTYPDITSPAWFLRVFYAYGNNDTRIWNLIGRKADIDGLPARLKSESGSKPVTEEEYQQLLRYMHFPPGFERGLTGMCGHRAQNSGQLIPAFCTQGNQTIGKRLEEWLKPAPFDTPRKALVAICAPFIKNADDARDVFLGRRPLPYFYVQQVLKYFEKAEVRPHITPQDLFHNRSGIVAVRYGRSIAPDTVDFSIRGVQAFSHPGGPKREPAMPPLNPVPRPLASPPQPCNAPAHPAPKKEVALAPPPATEATGLFSYWLENPEKVGGWIKSHLTRRGAQAQLHTLLWSKNQLPKGAGSFALLLQGKGKPKIGQLALILRFIGKTEEQAVAELPNYNLNGPSLPQPIMLKETAHSVPSEPQPEPSAPAEASPLPTSAAAPPEPPSLTEEERKLFGRLSARLRKLPPEQREKRLKLMLDLAAL